MGDLYGMAISEFVTISERHQEHGDHILHKERHSQSLSGGLQGRTAFVFGAGQYDGNVAGEIQFIRLSLASSGHQVRECTHMGWGIWCSEGSRRWMWVVGSHLRAMVMIGNHCLCVCLCVGEWHSLRSDGHRRGHFRLFAFSMY